MGPVTPQMLEEAGRTPLEPGEGVWPCGTSILDFWPHSRGRRLLLL